MTFDQAMKPIKNLILAVLFVNFIQSAANAATWYVDSAASGAGTGKSWTDAWKNVTNVSGVLAGDTVFISGGSSGNTQTYALTSSWNPAGGAAGNPITYRIGQDSAHNGTAVFSGGFWAGAVKNVVFSGDAGDAKMHFRIADNCPGRIWDGSNSLNARFSYVDCGRQVNDFYFNGGSGIEIDHIYFYKIGESTPGGAHDHFIYFQVSGAADTNKIHDSTIYLPNDANGYGNDGVQGGPQGVSIYNNNFIGYVTTYLGGQHQDGIQFLSGTDIHIYNNYFQDFANYPIYMEAFYGGFTHLYIYNNILCITHSGIRSSAPPQGISCGNSAGETGAWNWNDVIIANNLIADYGNSHIAIGLDNYSTKPATFTACYVRNNTMVNCPAGMKLNSSVTQSNNSQSAMANGAGHFVSYTQNQGSTADFHLVSGDTLYIGKGINLSSNFSIDKDGKIRPSSGAWCIGPYEFGGAPGPSPTPTASPTPSATPSPTPSPSVTPSPSATPTPSPSATPTPPPKFAIGDSCIVTPGMVANVRDNPAGNLLGSQPSGTIGAIMSDAVVANFNGVPVSWHQVQWPSAPQGWSGDDNLSPYTPPQPTPSPSPSPSPSATPSPSPTPTPPVTWENWIHDLNMWIRANPPYPDSSR